MNMNVLIIGFGRAGKRHARLLSGMGFTTGLYDIEPIDYDDVDAIYGEHRPRIYKNFDRALEDGIWDVAVVATPPAYHIGYIMQCLYNDMWVASEKPLTSFGREHEVNYLIKSKLPLERVQVQYNYRFNPDIRYLDTKIKSYAWQFVATQHRPELPSWGLLLDHCSHDIDIIRWISGKDFSILDCTYEKVSGRSESVVINGKMDDGTQVYIFDEVNFANRNHPRMARLFSPDGYADITANPEMFTKMWESFFESYRLGLPQYPSLNDALGTQRILEDAFRKEKINNVGESGLES